MVNNRLFFTLLLVFSLLSSLGGVDNSSYETDVEKLLIEAIIPGGAANEKRSELVVVDLSEESGKAIVDNGSVIEIGRGDFLLDGPAELFDVSYVTNSPEEISIKVDVGDFVLVKGESGGYEPLEINGSNVTLTPKVTREISYSFSDLYDIANETEVENFPTISGENEPELSAHGFQYVEDSKQEGNGDFSLTFHLNEYIDRGWIYFFGWWHQGAYFSDGPTDSLLKGFFEIHQTFSISLKDVTVIEMGYYKMDVTVTLEVVA